MFSVEDRGLNFCSVTRKVVLKEAIPITGTALPVSLGNADD